LHEQFLKQNHFGEAVICSALHESHHVRNLKGVPHILSRIG